MKENLSRRDFFRLAPVAAVAATEVFSAPVEAAPLEAPKTVKPEAFGIVDGPSAAAYFGNDIDPLSRRADIYRVVNSDSDPRIEVNHADASGNRPVAGDSIYLKGDPKVVYEVWTEIDSHANIRDERARDGKTAVTESTTANDGTLVPTRGGNLRFANSAAEASAIADELVEKLVVIERTAQPNVQVKRSHVGGVEACR